MSMRMIFYFLFPLIVLLYYLFPERYKKVWLLITNYYFYICFGLIWIVPLLLVTIISYCLGICFGNRIEKGHEPEKEINKKVLFTCLGCVLALWGIKSGIALAKTNSSFAALGLILPMGISFYSLQAVGYVVDVWQGKMQAEKNYLHYALFISFFPTIQSGPIVNARDFLPQVRENKQFDEQRVKNGLLLMLWGYFQKIAVADMAGILVDSVYEDYTSYSGSMIILATVLYAIQLYVDFGGYSHIAIGAAQILGYDLKANFKQPYLASHIKEFWNRWHISLSAWLKEYIYIPLGGNRSGNRYVNLMITFIVSGIWHGEALHYLVWGFLHGIFQIIEDIWNKLTMNKIRTGGGYVKRVRHFVGTCLTFIAVDFAWLFFRAASTKAAIDMLGNVWTNGMNFVNLGMEIQRADISALQMSFLIFGLLCVIVVDIANNKFIMLRNKIAQTPLVFRWGIYYAAILIVLVIMIANMEMESSAFIYGQF